MTIIALVLLGLCFGSFVNAFVFRLHEQSKLSEAKHRAIEELSIVKGRSMCPHCRHTLDFWDLLPVVSWLWLRGKCRYCHKPISWQYPLVELTTAGLFVLSYLVWSYGFALSGNILFASWLALLTGLLALLVYDARWMQLPFKITYPLIGFWAAVLAAVTTISVPDGVSIFGALLGGMTLGGFFLALSWVSKGRWIGGGDIPLGVLLGMLSGGIWGAMGVLFIASSLGSLYALPLMIAKKLTRSSHIPFGPFLIIAGVTMFLFGTRLMHWLDSLLLPY